MKCQPKKSVYEYCEFNEECQSSLGLVCYQNRTKCDCDDLVNNYWSNASMTCLPKGTYDALCIEDLECLDRQDLVCNLVKGKCECANNDYE